jgi:hypothetical protein
MARTSGVGGVRDAKRAKAESSRTLMRMTSRQSYGAVPYVGTTDTSEGGKNHNGTKEHFYDFETAVPPWEAGVSSQLALSPSPATPHTKRTKKNNYFDSQQ